jgi:nicotinamidase-related amidase
MPDQAAHGPIPRPTTGRHHLLVRDDCQLVVIDAQAGFFAGHARAAREGLDAVVARIAWLAGVAAALGVPVTITEEDPARNGQTDPSVLASAPPATRVFEKQVFGLAGQPEILAAIEAVGRRTVVLVGAETDVCVAQSALGLLEWGFRVAVVTDATFSPGEMHEHGLRRMRDAGAVLVHAKGLYYEWVRNLEAARAFEAAHSDLAGPPGFSL